MAARAVAVAVATVALVGTVGMAEVAMGEETGVAMAMVATAAEGMGVVG